MMEPTGPPAGTLRGMERRSFRDVNCSIAQTLEVAGEWWSMLIVRDLFLGVRRFDDLANRLGISRNVLTQRLGSLADHGVIERRPYQQRPLRHEYVLTPKGRDLWPVIDALRQWGDRWAAPDGPRVLLRHRGCGAVADPALRCGHCGEPVEAGDFVTVAGPGADERTLVARV